MSNNKGNVLVALIAGAAVGGVIGILFAPDKGSKTREKLRDGYEDAKKDLKHKYENVSEELKNKFSNTKNDIQGNYDDMVSNMSHKTEDVISFLEKKLAELKEQNAKLQKEKELTAKN